MQGKKAFIWAYVFFKLLDYLKQEIRSAQNEAYT